MAAKTNVWCRNHYCIHNRIGLCTKDNIGLELWDGAMLACDQYKEEGDHGGPATSNEQRMV